MAYRAELAAAKMDNVEVRLLAAYLCTLIGSNEFLAFCLICVQSVAKSQKLFSHG